MLSLWKKKFPGSKKSHDWDLASLHRGIHDLDVLGLTDLLNTLPLKSTVSCSGGNKLPVVYDNLFPSSVQVRMLCVEVAV